MKLINLIGRYFPIAIGSSTVSKIWDKDSLEMKINNILHFYLFDIEFYDNWTENGDEYFNVFKDETLKKMTDNIDDTLSKYFSFKKTRYSKNENVLVFHDVNSLVFDKHLFIDNWFKTNKTISNSLRNEYYNYRREYAGVILN